MAIAVKPPCDIHFYWLCLPYLEAACTNLKELSAMLREYRFFHSAKH